MIASKITSKGQITLPKKVRQALGVGPGDKVEFFIWGDRVTVQRARKGDLARLAGIFAGGPPFVSIDAEEEAAELQAVREVLDLPDDWQPRPPSRHEHPGALPDPGPTPAVRESQAPY